MIGPMFHLAFFRAITRDSAKAAISIFFRRGDVVFPETLVQNRPRVLVILTHEAALVLVAPGQLLKIDGLSPLALALGFLEHGFGEFRFLLTGMAVSGIEVADDAKIDAFHVVLRLL